MNPNIIIVRTVSIERLSQVLDCCRMARPEGRFRVVTSPNRVHELESDPRIAGVLPVQLGGNGFEKPIDLTGEVEATVFPVGNLSGAGYANVFAAFLKIKTRRLYLSPRCTTLVEMSRFALRRKVAWECLLRSVCRPLAAIASILIASYLYAVGCSLAYRSRLHETAIQPTGN